MLDRLSFGRLLSALPAACLAILLALGTWLAPGVAQAQTYPKPTISSFTPASGPVGTRITVTGTNLAAVNKALIGSFTASLVSVSATSVVITVAAGTTSGRIKLSNPSYTASAGTTFTVVPPPSITSFTPTIGLAGTTVTVSGRAFTGATGARIGNGTTVPATVSGSTRITFVVPAGAATGNVTVTTPAGSGTSASVFTVAPPPPVVSSFTPTSGLVGTKVTVTGNNFTGATSARIAGGSSAAVTVNSATKLSFVVPAGATSGTVQITSSAGSGSSTASFTVTAPPPPPTISGFSPASGVVGSTVTVSGSNFTGATSTQIGSSASTAVTVISATSLSFVVPTGATSGTVKVSSPAGTATSTASYTVTAPPVANAPVSEHIVVDQFGYRPTSVKTAVIRSPNVGYDSNRRYTPGATYRVIRASDGVSVLQGAPTVWNSGAVDASSGDAAWWFNFTALQTPGRYYVLDVDKNLRSPAFNIGTMVYQPTLKAAMRMFFYQRSGFAKRQPYAEACWTDEAAFVKANQDGQARDVNDRTNTAKIRDLSGGWFDAGDSNKYVTYAVSPVHQLLAAYEENPAAFTDDFNIPESGNGVPDVIDEVKWEIDWLKKMQNADGSALLKVGQITHNEVTPPSTSPEPRYYVPTCTSSTIAVAGMFAHAAYNYQRFPALGSEAADLRSRAIQAYDRFASSSTRQTNCDAGVVQYGDADISAQDQDNLQTVAAVYLYALTGEARFQDRVRSSYRAMRPYNDIGWNRYLPEQGSALLFYSTLANADSTLKTTIRTDKLNDANNSASKIYGLNANDDPYRAFLHPEQYHWGSHQPRANYGNSNRDVLSYNIGVASNAPFETRAEDTLHYFHGVNPFGMVYLSNVNSLGTTKSLSTIYHQAWFQDGHSVWDDIRTSSCGPAPGYVPGGANTQAQSNGVPSWMTPPTQQPAQKAYYEWNNPAEAAYAITEPGIYYQGAYVKLLSSFVRP